MKQQKIWSKTFSEGMDLIFSELESKQEEMLEATNLSIVWSRFLSYSAKIHV
jgi:hypothetical protein